MFSQLKLIKATRVRGIRHRIGLLRNEKAKLEQARQEVLDNQRELRAQWRQECAVSALVSIRQLGQLKHKLANYHRLDRDLDAKVDEIDGQAAELEQNLNAQRAALRENLRAQEKLDYLIEQGCT
jgi:hypothetical protein